MSLEPAVAALVGLVLLSELLLARQWLAIAAVIVACAGASRSAAGHADPPEPMPPPPAG
jgi:inner membrane transporter RhtA